MSAPHFQLFLGFLVDDAYQIELNRVDETQKQLFIKKESSASLQQISYDGKFYLGQYLDEPSDQQGIYSLQTLHAVEEGIYALISKLTPRCEGGRLLLFPAQVPA